MINLLPSIMTPMENSIWIGEEKKYLSAIENVKIPNERLDDVPSVIIKSEEDILKIGDGGGCYWIWTNEPVTHFFHKNPIPSSVDNGEIIYNGIAKDDVKGRIKHHLLSISDARWSGISLDIYFLDTVSHRKKVFAKKGKVPYVQKETEVLKSEGLNKGDKVTRLVPLRNIEDISKLNLSPEEQSHISKLDYKEIYFRNGIDVQEKKHAEFEFRVYYIVGLKSLYLDFVEKQWRNKYGTPKLCSYSSGR